jgi:hypothetical protein
MSIEGRKYLTPELANPRDFSAIDTVARLLAQSIPNIVFDNVTNLTIAGTHAEVIGGILKPEDYHNIKPELAKFKHDDPFISQLIEEIVAGDPDFDIYVWNGKIELKDILKNFQCKLNPLESDTRGRYYIDDTHVVSTTLEPISDKNDKQILHIQIIYTGGDKDENCFHFDLTCPPITRIQTGEEKRINNGGITEATQNRLIPVAGGFIVEENHRTKQIHDKIAQLNINLGKDYLPALIAILRNSRKLISAFGTDYGNGFANQETCTRLKEVATHLPSLIHDWSIDELKNIYREILVSAAYNPAQTIRALQESGLDLIVFGKTIASECKFKSNNEPPVTQFFKFLQENQIDFTHLLKQWTDSSFTSLLAPQPRT